MYVIKISLICSAPRTSAWPLVYHLEQRHVVLTRELPQVARGLPRALVDVTERVLDVAAHLVHANICARWTLTRGFTGSGLYAVLRHVPADEPITATCSGENMATI